MQSPVIRLLAQLCGWTVAGRAVVFLLSASSIWCLLAEFYGLCPMQTFTLLVSIPALTILLCMGVFDRRAGDGRLWRALLIGGTAGFIAALAYDVFRLPFVFAQPLGLSAIIPAMPLFKVFPRFGAMILGQAVEQPHYSAAAQLTGWAYHFSNGITFGIMYVALVGNPARRNWLWAVALAVGIEIAMLYTPYAQFFAIRIAAAFVVVTLTAHVIFGVVLGLIAKWMYALRRTALQDQLLVP